MVIIEMLTECGYKANIKAIIDAHITGTSKVRYNEQTDSITVRIIDSLGEFEYNEYNITNAILNGLSSKALAAKCLTVYKKKIMRNFFKTY